MNFEDCVYIPPKDKEPCERKYSCIPDWPEFCCSFECKNKPVTGRLFKFKEAGKKDVSDEGEYFFLCEQHQDTFQIDEIKFEKISQGRSNDKWIDILRKDLK
jgi:hypothetical protein